MWPDHFKTSQIWKEYGCFPCLRTFFDPGIQHKKAKYFTFVFKAYSTSSSTLSSSSSQSLIFECICNCQRFSEAFIAQTKQVLEIGIINFVYNHCRYFLRIKTACIFVCFTAHDKKLNFIFLHFISKKNNSFTMEQL